MRFLIRSVQAELVVTLAATLLAASCSLQGDTGEARHEPAAPVSATSSVENPPPDAAVKQVEKPSEPAATSAATPAASINVRLTVDAMHVVSTTSKGADGDRDETYFLAWTDGYKARLPSSDDYYEGVRGRHLQQSGWTNQDQKALGTPVLWSGSLADGERRIIYVLVAEQDGDPFLMNKYWPDIFASKPIDPLIPAAQAVRNENHEVIGGFNVLVRNVGGNLQLSSWAVGHETVDFGRDPNFGPNALRFVGKDAPGSVYHFVVNVTQQ